MLDARRLSCANIQTPCQDKLVGQKNACAVLLRFVALHLINPCTTLRRPRHIKFAEKSRNIRLEKSNLSQLFAWKNQDSKSDRQQEHERGNPYGYQFHCVGCRKAAISTA